MAFDGQKISVRTVAPSALLTTAQLKTHLRVDGTDEDTYIDGLLSAATAMLEGVDGMLGGKALGSQTWTYELGRVTGTTSVLLPITPVTSITSIEYYDADNALQNATVGDFQFYSDDDGALIEPKTGNSWPVMYKRADTLKITYVCGYAALPDTILHALKLIVGHWYENREEVTEKQFSEMPMAANHLISQHKKGWIAA